MAAALQKQDSQDAFNLSIISADAGSKNFLKCVECEVFFPRMEISHFTAQS